MLDRQSQLLGAETSKAESVGATMKRFGVYFRPYMWALGLTAVLVIVSTYMQVRIPELTGQAVDCYLGPYTAQQLAGGDDGGFAAFGGDGGSEAQDAFSNCTYTAVNLNADRDQILSGFGGLILLIAGLYVGSAVLSGITFFTMSWAGFKALRDIKADIFVHIHRLSLGYFTKHETGDVMSRVTNDMDTIQQVIGFGLLSVVQGSLLVIWIIYTMLSRSIPFALISLVTLPLMVILTQWFSGQARKAFRKARQEIGTVNADLQESISAVREVQAFSREDENIRQFEENNAANRDANIKAQIFTSALAPTLEALSFVSLAIVAGVGGWIILTGQDLFGTAISVGLIITFIAYTQQFNRPVQQIALLWTNIQSAIAGGERIFTLLDEVPDMLDKPNAKPMP